MRMLLLLTRVGMLVIAVAAQLRCLASPEHPQGDVRAVATAMDRPLERHRPYTLLLTSSGAKECPAPAKPDSRDIAGFACAPGPNQSEFAREASQLAITVRQTLDRDASHAALRAAGL